MLQMSPSVIKRHRLPPLYRIGLTVMWVVPLLIFISAIVYARGLDPAFFDVRFMGMALLMIAPAFYFWQEGVDVHGDGIYRRMHLPQYYRFSAMQRWQFDERPDRHVLTVWDAEGNKILECRAGHLTDFPALLDVLAERIER